MKRRPRPDRDRLRDLPPTVNKHLMAELMDRSVRWIEEQVAISQFPIPRIKKAPGLLWSRREVERWMEDATFEPLATEATEQAAV